VIVEDLVRWLGAQLDEDGRIARACPGDGEWEARHIKVYGPDLSAEVRAHMAVHDPARVLREIDAKRRVIAEAAEYEPGISGYAEMWTVLRLLALPYADRPGYREEWAP
jgi:hypothetical protein